MASGLATPRWNNADILAEDLDRAALLTWYEQRDVPWGIRVPSEMNVDLGAPLFVKRCAALLPGGFTPAPPVGSVSVRRARSADLDAYAAVELSRFGGDDELERLWLMPAIGAAGFAHWMATADDKPVAVAMTVLTTELAGPAAYLAGVAVVPAWVGRGLDAQLAATACAAAFDAGAALVHTNPDDDELGWVASLGFVEVPGFLVRVVRFS